MLTEEIKKLSEKYYQTIVNLRHQFHMNPELAFEEYETSKTVYEELKKLGIEVVSNVAKTGVVGLIKGKYPGKTVLLRAEMDALPIQEEVDIPYKSKVPNKMHACGHDGNTASLLGTAMILNELKDELHGTVKLVFQPAEEDGGGAKPMIDEGVLENPHVDAAFASHMRGRIPDGKVHVEYGRVMASPAKFSFKIIGKGGHAAMPHLGIDPVAIAAQVINNMQLIISRRISPLEPAVISCCSIHGGNAFNAIPDEVEVKGTIRTFSSYLSDWIPETMEQILKGITESQGASYEFNVDKQYPPLINDDNMTDILKKSISKIVGIENVGEEEPTMGGEDFAYFGQHVPASFFFIGINKDKNSVIKHHQSKFAWDDKNMLIQTRCMAQVAVDFLNGDEG